MGTAANKITKNQTTDPVKGHLRAQAYQPAFSNIQAGILGLQDMAGNHAVNQALDSENINEVGPIHNSANSELKPLPSANATVADAKGLPPSVSSLLTGGGGRPLEPGIRSFMESQFGYDFSAVRVHTGGSAADSARKVNAAAYTVGKDVVFGEGGYAPGSLTGKELMAHELAHTVQQRPGANEAPGAGSDSISERAADSAAQTAMTNGCNAPVIATGIGIARQSLEDDLSESVDPRYLSPEHDAIVGSEKVDDEKPMTLGRSLNPASFEVADLKNEIDRIEDWLMSHSEASDMDVNHLRIEMEFWRDELQKKEALDKKWTRYMKHLEEVWNREDSTRQRMWAVRGWSRFMSYDEFEKQLERNPGFRLGTYARSKHYINEPKPFNMNTSDIGMAAGRPISASTHGGYARQKNTAELNQLQNELALGPIRDTLTGVVSKPIAIAFATYEAYEAGVNLKEAWTGETSGAHVRDFVNSKPDVGRELSGEERVLKVIGSALEVGPDVLALRQKPPGISTPNRQNVKTGQTPKLKQPKKVKSRSERKEKQKAAKNLEAKKVAAEKDARKKQAAEKDARRKKSRLKQKAAAEKNKGQPPNTPRNPKPSTPPVNPGSSSATGPKSTSSAAPAPNEKNKGQIRGTNAVSPSTNRTVPPKIKVSKAGHKKSTSSKIKPQGARRWNDPMLTENEAVHLYNQATLKKPLKESRVREKYRGGWRFDPVARRWKKPFKTKAHTSAKIAQEAGRIQEKVVSDITGWPKNTKKHPTSHGDRIPDYLVEKDPKTGKWVTAKKPADALFVADSKYYDQTTIGLTDQIKGFVEIAGKTAPPSGRKFLLFITNKTAKIDQEVIKWANKHGVTVRQVVQNRSL